MTLHSFQLLSLLLLAAAVFSVPLARLLGLGAVVGYLLVGALIGPLVQTAGATNEDILHFSELGVVLFLFLTGLEINLKNLWSLRTQVFGLGSLQMLLCSLLFFFIAFIFVGDWKLALVIGLCLAFSSTAIALQNLNETGELASLKGRMQLAILLLQDLAVVPVLAFIVFLSPITQEKSMHWPLLALLQISSIVALYLGGKHLLNPLFHIMGKMKSRETLTALTLFIVLGFATFMNEIGMSMALGGFLAGLVLSESEYRYQLESDIETFKNIILALFFLAVGMTIRWDFFLTNIWFVSLLCIGYLVLKTSVLFFIARIGSLSKPRALSLALNISQGSEFAFIVIQAATNNALMTGFYGDLITLLVVLSMVLSSFMNLFLPSLKIFFKSKKEKIAPDYDVIENATAPVILVGFGRFGQVPGSILDAHNIPFTAIEKDVKRINLTRSYISHFKVYYGDPTELNLLRSAGADKAECIAIAIDEPKVCVKIVEMANKYFPHLKILVRARDRVHSQQLLKLGIPKKFLYRELLESSLAMTTGIFEALNFKSIYAKEIANIFRDFDQKLLHEDISQYKGKKRHEKSYENAKKLNSLFSYKGGKISSR